MEATLERPPGEGQEAPAAARPDIREQDVVQFLEAPNDELHTATVSHVDASGLLVKERDPGTGKEFQKKIPWTQSCLTRVTDPEVVDGASGPVGPLTDEERRRLERCEEVVERGKQTFVEVGTALDTIRAGRLYRAAFPSFEAYLRQRWGFSRATAYRMMEAAEVAKNLSQVETNIFTASAPVPANVAQAQALSGLPPEKQPEAWQRAQEIADGPVTAADVREAVKQVQPPPPATSPAATAAPGPAPAPPPATAAAPSATPAPPPATAPAGQPAAQAPSAMVHCLIAEADYDWLLDQGLTMAQAFGQLRRFYAIAERRSYAAGYYLDQLENSDLLDLSSVATDTEEPNDA